MPALSGVVAENSLPLGPEKSYRAGKNDFQLIPQKDKLV
jgi:hypothetical protein